MGLPEIFLSWQACSGKVPNGMIRWYLMHYLLKYFTQVKTGPAITTSYDPNWEQSRSGSTPGSGVWLPGKTYFHSLISEKPHQQFQINLFICITYKFRFRIFLPFYLALFFFFFFVREHYNVAVSKWTFTHGNSDSRWSAWKYEWC